MKFPKQRINCKQLRTKKKYINCFINIHEISHPNCVQFSPESREIIKGNDRKISIKNHEIFNLNCMNFSE